MKLYFIKASLFIFFISILTIHSICQNIKYQEIIQSADNYFNKGDYINAKAAYQYALRFDKDNEYAKERVNKCIDFMHSQSEERIKYSQLIQQADKDFENKNLNIANITYQNALKLFPNEKYPQQKIAEISQIIKENNELETDYDEAIKAGDHFIKLGNYSEARLEYQYALGLFPNRIYPKQQLEEIALHKQDMNEKKKIYEEILAKAENLYYHAEWRQALDSYLQANRLFPDEELPRRKIEELTPLISQLDKYKAIIDSADNLYSVKDYLSAKIKYEEAIKISPNESYPLEMLNKINLAIQTKTTTELEDYKNAVNLGDLYMNEKKWEDAKNQFEFANRLKPDEVYPKERLVIIVEKLKEEEKLTTLRNKYDNLIKNAEQYFAAKDYTEAKQVFADALFLMPDKTYPNEKINEINKIEKENAAKKELFDKYQTALNKAENLLKNKDYVPAKLAFEEAKNLKPEEEYPKQKIIEIDLILEQITAEQTIEQNYQNTIKIADSYFNNKDYEHAQIEYQKAQNIKKDEEYPQEQLTIIKDIFEQNAITIQNKYNQYITNAKNLFILKQYEAAKNVLHEAEKLKPEEDYPKQKMIEIDSIIATNYSKAKTEYDNFIKEAENYYKSKVYEKALESYQKANKILPTEEYAKEKIFEITDLFNEATLTIINKTSIKINPGEITQLPFTPIPFKNRESNYFYLDIQNAKIENNLRLFVNYGKDQIKNGGVVIRLDDNNKNNIHLIKLSSQYKWFSEDNNWINLQVEGGSVEIGVIKITKGIIL